MKWQQNQLSQQDASQDGQGKQREQQQLAYVRMNDWSRECKVIVDEMRMQIQTQLDPSSVEHLVFDTMGSSHGCEDLKLAINMRTISQYNFEQLKERLRGFTRTVFDSVESVS